MMKSKRRSKEMRLTIAKSLRTHKKMNSKLKMSSRGQTLTMKQKETKKVTGRIVTMMKTTKMKLSKQTKHQRLPRRPLRSSVLKLWSKKKLMKLSSNKRSQWYGTRKRNH